MRLLTQRLKHVFVFTIYIYPQKLFLLLDVKVYSYTFNQLTCFTSWWFQPLWNILDIFVNLDHLPPIFGVKIPKIFENCHHRKKMSPKTSSKWATKKPSYFPLYWLVQMDPYIGLLKSPYNWVVFHPLYNLNKQGFSLCSNEVMGPVFSWPSSWRWLGVVSKPHRFTGRSTDVPLNYLRPQQMGETQPFLAATKIANRELGENKNILVGGFNPIEKNISQFGSFPPSRCEH